MASATSSSASFKAIVSLLFLALTISFVSSARVLDEEVLPGPVVTPVSSIAPVATTTAGVSGVAPVATSTAGVSGVAPVATSTGGVSGVAPVATSTGGVSGVAPVATTTAAVTSGTVAKTDPHHELSFFMHDILGGTNPSAKAVTGIVTNPAVNGQLPFAKPNGAVLNVNNGVPLNNGNNAVVNNNNLPFLTGLSGNTQNVIQNNGNNGNNFNGGGIGFQVGNGGQLPGGAALQQLMFGTMTVIDDELTEGHELESGTIGKAQGFYVASSVDGTSQTMAFTVMFVEGGFVDSLSFFGVHRTAVSESQLAVMGGTGKYVNAKGIVNVKTIPATHQQNTDGLETLLEITVYLTY